MKTQYLFKSRYREYSVLNQVNEENSMYQFVPCPGPCRIIAKTNENGPDFNSIAAIDPSGGPFIEEGFDLGDATVELITTFVDGRIIFKLKEK